MKITVLFPTVMKFEFRAVIDIDESEDLPIINQKVFEAFWRAMVSFSPLGKHGSSEQIILSDSSNVEITSQADFKASLAKSSNFSAVFKAHPLLRSS